MEAQKMYSQVLKEIAAVGTQLKLKKDEQAFLREFVMKVAKEHYRNGTRAGIRWVRSGGNLQLA